MSASIAVSAPVDDAIERVRVGIRDLLSDLGYDDLPVIDVRPPSGVVAATLDGTLLEADPDFEELLGDAASALVVGLVHERRLVVSLASPVEPAREAVEDAPTHARLLLASFGGRWDGSAPAPSEQAGTWLARGLSHSDDRPLRLRFSPIDVDDLRSHVLAGSDADLRRIIFDNSGLPLPPTLDIDPSLPPGRVGVSVRDVHYPPLPVSRDDPDATDRLGRYVGRIVEANPASLLTPTAADALLVLAQRSVPVAVRLATARWPRAELTDFLRVGLSHVRPAPTDVPALIEAIALAPHPDAPRDEADLAGHFAGLSTGFDVF